MIKFANQQSKPLVRSMWKTVFEDEDQYIDLIFSKKYRDENTLIYFVGKEAVASLQMIPYKINFWGEPIDFYYLSGLCTLPDHRNKGYMHELILRSFEVMGERNIPLSILVPAEEWLFGYYERYGFATTFPSGDKPLDLDWLAEQSIDNNEKFIRFDSLYQNNDFTVLKTEADFDVILDDLALENFPQKYNLKGMSRVIDVLFCLRLYAQKNKNHQFAIRVNDDVLKSHQNYFIEQGSVEVVEDGCADLEIDVKLLTSLLFGYKTAELGTPFNSFSPEQTPRMNLMLE